MEATETQLPPQLLSEHLENTPLAIIEWDEKLTIKKWSKRAEEIFGWAANETLGKKMSGFHFVHEHDIHRVKKLAKQLSDQPLEKNLSVNRNYKKSGEVIYCEWYNSILRNQEGNVITILSLVNDITEKKKAEDELRKSEERFRALIEHSHDAISMINEKGEIIFRSAAAEKMTGFTSAEVRGRKILEMIHPDDAKEAAEFYEQLLKEPGVAKHKTHRVLHKDGHYIWTEGTMTNLLHHESIKAIVSNFHDITERKNAEEELVKSELRYRSLIDQASDAIMITDDQGNFVDVNSELCKMFGYQREELLHSNLIRILDPVSLNNDPVRFDLLLKGHSILRERKMMHRDGTVIDVEANVKMLPDGKILAIARQITERKKSEAILKESEFRLRMVSENEILGVAWCSPDGKLLQANNTFYKMLGYREEELKGVYFGDFTHPLDTEKELDLVADIFKGAIENYRIEKRYKTKKGEYIWVDLNLSCYRNPVDKKIEFFVGIIQNINERKRAEDKLRSSEHKYRLLFNKNPLPMWIMSEPGLHIIDVNDAAIAHYGFSKEEFLSMAAVDLRPAEDREKFLEAAAKTYRGVTHWGTWRHRKKDGTDIRVEVIGHSIMYEGKSTRLILAHDVTEKIIAEEKLKESHMQLRQLSSHMENIREEERTSIAREIHDELGQQLTGLKMDASWLSKKIPAENKIVRDKIAGMIALIDETVKVVRRISSELRPGILDDLGLIDALDWQSSEFEKRTAIRCRFRSMLKDARFDKNLSTGIFRVYQETLTNVARHSNASEIKTLLEEANGVFTLSMRDNGIGFDEKEIKNKNTLGLLGMRERATMFGGNLVIESTIGKGTSIILEVPMKGE